MSRCSPATPISPPVLLDARLFEVRVMPGRNVFDAVAQAVAQVDELLELSGVERVAELAVDGAHMFDRDPPEEVEPCFGDADDGAPAVVGVGQLDDQLAGGEAIDEAADARLRDEHVAVEVFEPEPPPRRS